MFPSEPSLMWIFPTSAREENLSVPGGKKTSRLPSGRPVIYPYDGKCRCEYRGFGRQGKESVCKSALAAAYPAV
jgi:hypothetical protein